MSSALTASREQVSRICPWIGSHTGRRQRRPVLQVVVGAAGGFWTGPNVLRVYVVAVRVIFGVREVLVQERESCLWEVVQIGPVRGLGGMGPSGCMCVGRKLRRWRAPGRVLQEVVRVCRVLRRDVEPFFVKSQKAHA